QSSRLFSSIGVCGHETLDTYQTGHVDRGRGGPRVRGDLPPHHGRRSQQDRPTRTGERELHETPAEVPGAGREGGPGLSGETRAQGRTRRGRVETGRPPHLPLREPRGQAREGGPARGELQSLYEGPRGPGAELHPRDEERAGGSGREPAVGGDG